MGTTEIILLVGIIAIVVAVVVGRSLASGLRDDQRKIAGGVALLVGIVLAIYGISSVNSAGSQVMGAMGRPDVGGMAAVGFGVLAAAIGLIIAISKASKTEGVQSTSTRKCPFCAETIQSEAKVCRFCNNALET